MHVRSVHNDLWFKCEHCDYKASQKCNLVRHKQFKHEGRIYYRCDQCSYTACNKQKLDKHIQENVHENGRNEFNCVECDFKAAQTNPTWQPSMMENAFSVMNVITRVPQSNH